MFIVVKNMGKKSVTVSRVSLCSRLCTYCSALYRRGRSYIIIICVYWFSKNRKARLGLARPSFTVCIQYAECVAYPYFIVYYIF